MKELSRSLEEFGLPIFKHDWINALNRGTNFEFSGNSLIDEQLAYNAQDEKATFRTNYALFNSNQKCAFDTIVDKLQSADLLDDTSNANFENVSAYFFDHQSCTITKTLLWIKIS